jgi:methylphosphotriester-DNA--protein-cysteine methyltransferase
LEIENEKWRRFGSRVVRVVSPDGDIIVTNLNDQRSVVIETLQAIAEKKSTDERSEALKKKDERTCEHLRRVEKKLDQITQDNPRLREEIGEFAQPLTRKKSQGVKGSCRHIGDLTHVVREIGSSRADSGTTAVHIQLRPWKN